MSISVKSYNSPYAALKDNKELFLSERATVRSEYSPLTATYDIASVSHVESLSLRATGDNLLSTDTNTNDPEFNTTVCGEILNLANRWYTQVHQTQVSDGVMPSRVIIAQNLYPVVRCILGSPTIHSNTEKFLLALQRFSPYCAENADTLPAMLAFLLSVTEKQLDTFIDSEPAVVCAVAGGVLATTNPDKTSSFSTVMDRLFNNIAKNRITYSKNLSLMRAAMIIHGDIAVNDDMSTIKPAVAHKYSVFNVWSSSNEVCELQDFTRQELNAIISCAQNPIDIVGIAFCAKSIQHKSGFSKINKAYRQFSLLDRKVFEDREKSWEIRSKAMRGYTDLCKNRKGEPCNVFVQSLIATAPYQMLDILKDDFSAFYTFAREMQSMVDTDTLLGLSPIPMYAQAVMSFLYKKAKGDPYTMGKAVNAITHIFTGGGINFFMVKSLVDKVSLPTLVNLDADTLHVMFGREKDLAFTNRNPGIIPGDLRSNLHIKSGKHNSPRSTVFYESAGMTTIGIDMNKFLCNIPHPAHLSVFFNDDGERIS